jgi:hypothetical protein
MMGYIKIFIIASFLNFNKNVFPLSFRSNSLKCQKCKYHYKPSANKQSKCMRFIKNLNSTHRLISNGYDINTNMFAYTDECINNEKLCGSNLKEFVLKSDMWK